MENNSWLKITVVANPVLADPLSDFIVGALEAGVEMGAIDEPGYGTVTCYIENPNPDPKEIEAILTQIQSHLTGLEDIFQVEKSSMSWEIIEDQDWGKNWKKHFKPFEIVPGLIIAPTWEEYLAVAGEAVITMDPGMAFGTGHHATTTLSLEFIRETLAGSSGKTILDVGTGTGILAMAGLLFEGASALGIDNDPEAVSAAKDNVQQNELQERMEVSVASLSSLTTEYDLVVANIVHDVLVAMADELTRVVAKGGTLILSGILAGEQLANIKSDFTSKGLVAGGEKQRDEWVAIRFFKK